MSHNETIVPSTPPSIPNATMALLFTFRSRLNNLGYLHPSWSHQMGRLPIINGHHNEQKNLGQKKKRIKHQELNRGTIEVPMDFGSQRYQHIFSEMFYILFIEPIMGKVSETTITLKVAQRITQDKTNGTKKVNTNLVVVVEYQFTDLKSVDRTNLEHISLKRNVWPSW